MKNAGGSEGGLTVRRIDPMRRVIIDGLQEARRWHHVPVFFQADVTTLMRNLSVLKASGHDTPTVTAFIIQSFAKAVENHRAMQAIRVGERLHIYDDVDVSTVIEKTSMDGEAVPTLAIVRQANRRDLADIGEELHAAKSAPGDRTLVGSEAAVKRSNFLVRLPRFLRKMALWYLRRRPGLRKETMGTVHVSSVGMFTAGLDSMWAIPPAPWPLALSVFNTFRELRPGPDGRACEREICNMTLVFDHDIADGFHAARLIADFKVLLENPSLATALDTGSKDRTGENAAHHTQNGVLVPDSARGQAADGG